MSKKISTDDEKEIVRLGKLNISNVKIATKLNVSDGTVRNYLKKHGIEKQNNQGGRPKILNLREERYVLREFENGNIQTTTHGVSCIKEKTGKNVSRDLISKMLKKDGFKNYRSIKKPSISSKNKKARRKFFMEHQKKNFQDFSKIIFSDESSYKLINARGGQTYFKKSNSSGDFKNYIRTEKFGKGSIMIWGFMTGCGNFRICKVDGTMNSSKYVKMLEEFFFDEITELGIKLGDVIFQQDNASCHVSSLTKKWFSEQKVHLLEWPPQSPDMNPIENVWNYLDIQVRKRQQEISTVNDLYRIIQEEAKKIPKSFIKKLYRSMPRRIQALKNSKYDITKY